MKIQLIVFKDREPIIVSDEKISGKIAYNPSNKKVEFVASHPKYEEYGLKIIAGIPELPSIDFSALSEEDCKKIGWVDVEKLAIQDYKQFNLSAHHGDGTRQDYYDCFSRGFKTAQSLNEKKYSEEDVFNATGIAIGLWSPSYASFEENWKEKIIQSISQPKVFDIEVDITNNSIKITKINV